MRAATTVIRAGDGAPFFLTYKQFQTETSCWYTHTHTLAHLYGETDEQQTDKHVYNKLDRKRGKTTTTFSEFTAEVGA